MIEVCKDVTAGAKAAVKEGQRMKATAEMEMPVYTDAKTLRY